MPSPFPGMNPYLEHPDRWPTVHNRLIVAIADLLTPQLLPKYQIDIDKRVYEVTGLNTLLIGRPDVTVQQSRASQQLPTRQSSIELEKSPLQVVLPIAEEVRESYLEVKDAQTQAVITAIEILSPTNKRGEGRQKYLNKREKILSSRTNLVEIDLLVQGEPPPLIEDNVNTHYRMIVSRSASRPIADLYAFNLTEKIPTIPLPLVPGEKELTIDLQMLLDAVYDRSGYDYFIDYQQSVDLSLSEEDINWIDSQLREKGLRS